MRIDIHAHYLPDEYLDLLANFGHRPPATARVAVIGDSAEGLKARFQMMDAAEVNIQVLSVANQTPYFEEEAPAVEGARMANGLYAALVDRYPDRFRAFAILPLPHMDASIREVGVALDNLGMVGITVTTTVLGRSLADPHFEPLYAELNQRGATLFVHPAHVGAGEQTNPYGLSTLVGCGFEDTIAALQLVLSGLTSRYPAIRIVIGHLGGSLPFVSTRVDSQFPAFDTGLISEPPSVLLKRLWYDTVSHGHTAALRLSVEMFGFDRFLLGSDYPVLLGDRYVREMTYVAEAGLPTKAVAAIESGNAQQLLRLVPDSGGPLEALLGSA
jgi:6-methylsalicylate decarboxylase